jgi:hypothetical protein
MPTERTITAVERAPFALSQVNREAGHIDGVLICGVQSRNGRDYPPAVLARDYARYESAPVNADHGDESTVGRRLGWFSDVRPGPDGRPRGRLNLLKSHPLAESVFEAAERNPSLFGMSHVAVCGTKRVNGRETVESINKVLSIDLVADPATTKSLYESYHPTEQPMKLRTYCEQVAAKWPAVAPKLRVLTEMDDMGEMEMDAPPDLGAMSDPGDPVEAAFTQAMHALVDMYATDKDLVGLLKKLKELGKAHGKMSDSGTEAPSEPVETEEPAEMEGVKTALAAALAEVKSLRLDKLFSDAGVTPSEIQRKAVAGLTDDADRVALVESFKQSKSGQSPRSGEQNAQKQKTTTTGSIPTDGKAFAESLKKRSA